AGLVAAALRSADPGAAPATGKGRVDVGAEGRPRAATDRAGVTVTVADPAPAPVPATASGPPAAGLVATSQWRSATPTLRGLATSACLPAVTEAWLLAGGGDPGRQERLVLVNPGGNEVTADVRLLGRAGPVARTATGTVVPPRGRAVLLLDALAPTEASPVVHVTVDGGTVAPTLTDTWLDGSVPAGADSTGPAAAPARTQVVPGLVLAGRATVRVGVPGSREAVVSARLLGADGAVPLPGTGVARVRGASVGELTVSGVPDGRYAVEVRADVPVVAAVQGVVRAGRGPGDLAWAAAAPALGGLAGAAFPPSPAGPPTVRTLTLVASGDPVTAEVVTAAGGRTSSRRVAVPADSAVAVGLGAPSAVWVRPAAGGGELRAAVDTAAGSAADRLVSVVALAPTTLTERRTGAVAVP
ncbi:MAG TPA: DUF5719 family protein, partial [Dermatophilaceae bacterium]|nr:DUF5719 family protein [Dermatophilaceae bacterium]